MRKHAYAALVLCLSACGGRSVQGPAGSARVGDAGADAGPDAQARRCTFKGFASAVSYATAKEPLSIVAVDLTGTGHLDLIAGEVEANGFSSELLVNAGDGTFALTGSYGASANNVNNLVAADFNGDGRVDLASESSGVSGIDLGTGGSAFAPSLVPFPTQQSEGYLAAGDFNGDGHPDIAFAGYDNGEIYGGLPEPIQTNFALSVFLNAGAGTFAAPATYANPRSFLSLATGDFDGDGQLDLAELTSAAVAGISIFFNAGGGVFRSEANYPASDSESNFGLGIADFNGDGKDDLATTTVLSPNTAAAANVLEVFSGAAGGSINGPVYYPIANVPDISTIVTGDFNGDGKPDLAMVMAKADAASTVPTPVNVFENQGDGTFGAPVIYGVGGVTFEYASAVAAGDFNGDGVTDIAVTTSGVEPPYPWAVNVLLSQCE
ncbi:MAG TPA: VCBS repeat-containing protein [Polyangiaceae bacterium]|nr:VCBS repeat-containing protein [Polyangiaceae bacterium]